MYEKLLDDSGLKDSPNRIFNLDETGLNTNPLSQKMFMKRGSKTTYLNSASCGKQNYSVLFCCSASGEFLPPFVVLCTIYLFHPIEIVK